MNRIAISISAAGMLCLAPIGAAAAPHASAHTGSSMDASATTTMSQHTSPTMRGPASTGQPNKTCGTAGALETPGQAASAPGSAFNPDGKAGTVYAGQQPQNSRNTASVSQYDVACSRQP